MKLRQIVNKFIVGSALALAASGCWEPSSQEVIASVDSSRSYDAGKVDGSKEEGLPDFVLESIVVGPNPAIKDGSYTMNIVVSNIGSAEGNGVIKTLSTPHYDMPLDDCNMPKGLCSAYDGVGHLNDLGGIYLVPDETKKFSIQADVPGIETFNENKKKYFDHLKIEATIESKGIESDYSNNSNELLIPVISKP